MNATQLFDEFPNLGTTVQQMSRSPAQKIRAGKLVEANFVTLVRLGREESGNFVVVATVLASMKTHTTYQAVVVIKPDSTIKSASCSCAVGRGRDPCSHALAAVDDVARVQRQELPVEWTAVQAERPRLKTPVDEPLLSKKERRTKFRDTHPGAWRAVPKVPYARRYDQQPLHVSPAILSGDQVNNALGSSRVILPSEHAASDAASVPPLGGVSRSGRSRKRPHFLTEEYVLDD
eukprot:TRINITY_DN159_c0_g1_i1.p1 TRINITY_DN159_c0_g1~~TRINITY_DN159_c0_g1_i1.p1  ORF type:complete len:234 (+),score=3.67 TRINITY_DN159_c0_g1_i1:200-901(+)